MRNERNEQGKVSTKDKFLDLVFRYGENLLPEARKAVERVELAILAATISFVVFLLVLLP